MKGGRVFRVLFGILMLAAFCFYFHGRYVTSPHSSDFDTEHAFIYSEALERIAREEAEMQQQNTVPLPVETAAAETPQPEIPDAVEMETPAEPESDLPQIDISAWPFVLVNASHPLDASFAPATTPVSDSQVPVDSRIVEPLQAFLQGCRDAGLPVYLSSGYRAYSEQQYLFQRKLDQGYSYEGASTIVAPPGTSEHQTGLACDITDVYRESKSWEQLEPTATFQWLYEHCAEYGFILRYPKDKSGLQYDGSALTTVTGIIYEPWHFRFVGVEAAQYIMSHNLCLEEFWELYIPGTIPAAA